MGTGKIKKLVWSQPVNPVLGRLRKEDCQNFMGSLGYIVMTRPRGYTARHCIGKEREVLSFETR